MKASLLLEIHLTLPRSGHHALVPRSDRVGVGRLLPSSYSPKHSQTRMTRPDAPAGASGSRDEVRRDHRRPDGCHPAPLRLPSSRGHPMRSARPHPPTRTAKPDKRRSTEVMLPYFASGPGNGLAPGGASTPRCPRAARWPWRRRSSPRRCRSPSALAKPTPRACSVSWVLLVRRAAAKHSNVYESS
jgi:hypothetical protein